MTKRSATMCSTALLILAILAWTVPASDAEPIAAVTSTNALLFFDSATPGTASSVAITGLQSGETILGIDRRPATGQLYALGSTSRLYTINTTTGVATQVGSAGSFTLSGTSFGFDFNPTVDRIRVTSDLGQNLRLNPNDGTLTAADTPLNPGTPHVVGSAYTNNFSGAVTTTLFDIDSLTDVLDVQNPPNNGTLTLVGSLGFNTADAVGFDISGLSGIAFASLTPVTGAASGLFLINLNTGAATFVGTIGTGFIISDIAASVGSSAVPEPSTVPLLGLGVAMILGYRRRTKK